MKEAERDTRLLRIDPRLQASGWTVVEPDASVAMDARNLAIRELETANGPADYALLDAERVLGVVEAKKVALGPQEVLIQAERYAKGIQQKPLYQGEFGVPFLYATNGEVLWFKSTPSSIGCARSR